MTPGAHAPRSRRSVPKGPSRGATLLLVGLAAPVALLVELAVRAFVPIPGIAEVRAELGEAATILAWAMVVATVPAALLGRRLHRGMVRRGLARSPEASAEARERIDLEALLLASTVPQLPALLAIVTAIFGAELRPVAVAVAASTVAVVAMGLGHGAAGSATGSGSQRAPGSGSAPAAGAESGSDLGPGRGPGHGLDGDPDPSLGPGPGPGPGLSPDDVVVLPIEDWIDLHTFQPRDIPSVVDEYLHEARARGFREVRVVHGRGKGVQRATVQALLTRHPAVESFGDAPATRGGWGATLVWLKPR